METDVKQTGPLDVNTYILKDESTKEAVLIDVGGSFEIIKKELDLKGYEIKFILNTHGHFDHVLGEIEARKKYPDLSIYMHKDDISHIQKLKEETAWFNCKYDEETLSGVSFIDENSDLYIGKTKIKILYTPGHSKGGLSYYIPGSVFSGDTLFFRSIGRTDFYDGDYDTLVNSIKTKLFTLPDETKVYPGHGINTTISSEKKYNTCLSL